MARVPGLTGILPCLAAVSGGEGLICTVMEWSIPPDLVGVEGVDKLTYTVPSYPIHTKSALTHVLTCTPYIYTVLVSILYPTLYSLHSARTLTYPVLPTQCPYSDLSCTPYTVPVL